MRLIEIPIAYSPISRRAFGIALLAAGGALLLGLLGLPAVWLLLALNLLILAPVLYGLKMWILMFDTEDLTLD